MFYYSIFPPSVLFNVCAYILLLLNQFHIESSVWFNWQRWELGGFLFLFF